MVYNMCFDSIGSMGSAFVKEPLSQFWCSNNNQDNMVFKLPITKDMYVLGMYYVDSISTENLGFDFLDSTSNALYCSELVCNIINYMSRDKYHIHKRVVSLSVFEKYFLKDSVLSYYPADFFIELPNIEQINQ